MADFLKRLSALVPPPAEPFEAGDAEAFHQVEAQLSLELPPDYKALVNTYGSGQWQEFWCILNPFTEGEFTNLVTQSSNRRPKKWSTLDAERAVREAEGGRYPHPIYPEPGGILPWAITDNGGRFFWLTKGSPKKWPTIYYAGRSPDFQVFDIPCTELLFKAVAGESAIFEGPFGSDYLYGQPNAFVPIQRKRKRSKA